MKTSAFDPTLENQLRVVGQQCTMGVCVDTVAGFIRNEDGLGTTPCAEGTFTAVAQNNLECTACPGGTTSPAQSTSVDQCTGGLTFTETATETTTFSTTETLTTTLTATETTTFSTTETLTTTLTDMGLLPGQGVAVAPVLPVEEPVAATQLVVADPAGNGVLPGQGLLPGQGVVVAPVVQVAPGASMPNDVAAAKQLAIGAVQVGLLNNHEQGGEVPIWKSTWGLVLTSTMALALVALVMGTITLRSQRASVVPQQVLEEELALNE